MEKVVEIMGAPSGKQADGKEITLIWEFNENHPKYGLVERVLSVEFIDYRVTAIMRSKFDVPVYIPQDMQ